MEVNRDGYYMGITVVFGYSFLVASFVLVLVAERENKVVQQEQLTLIQLYS